jgi:hypothetical protein
MHRHNLKQQFENEVDEYDTPVKDHHTEKMVVTPGTTAFKRELATQYLMGFSGMTELVLRDLEQLNFYDPGVTFQVIQPMHKMAVANWRVQTQFGMSIGPDHARILDKMATFPTLHSTKQRDVLAWLKQLPNLLAGYKILLMPFDHIELRFGPVGLCIPGVGTEKFGMMGSALAMVLDKIISNQIDRRILNLLAIVKNKVPSNGYNVLHKLLTETVDCFNPNSIMIDYPHYSDYEDIYGFAEDFDSFVAMKRRKGERVTDKAAAMSFLEIVMKGVSDRMYMGAYLLRQELMEYSESQDLPDKFELAIMAATIATSGPKQDDYDLNRKNRGANVHKTEQINQTRNSSDNRTMENDVGARLNGHIQGYSHTIYQCNAVYRQQSGRRSFPRPTPDPTQQKKWKFDWSILCKACGRVGHDAAHCHTLAMGVLLYKYWADKDNAATIRAASDAWHEKNTKALRPKGATQDTGRTPMQAVANMVDNYWIQVDQIDDELDWHCFEISPQDESADTEEAGSAMQE